ncbi:MAG TPA: hypothetical protein VMF69_12150 [Gemmataceae bacterium]|nr:hypothetical protein [Gemmataceae bacterium]
MILLLFFFPLAIYLLLLGFLNRGRHPLLISGVWDGIGLIFGVSGFLLFAGPAILSTLNERWRLFWLFFKVDVPPAGTWSMWIFLSFLYFLLVVGGAALYLWRQRSLTAIYNANADLIERTVIETCKQMGINPVCSGGLFVFGPSSRGVAGGSDHEREQTAILEVDSFPLMRHVTLRWEPAASPLRRIVETELSRRLSETAADDSLLGGWLLSLGFLLLSFDLAGVFFLVILYLHMFAR